MVFLSFFSSARIQKTCFISIFNLLIFSGCSGGGLDSQGWPVKTPPNCPEIGSDYGDWTDINGNHRLGPHWALDFPASHGHSVLAVATARIVGIGRENYGGRWIALLHSRFPDKLNPSRFASYYYHLDSIAKELKIGQEITVGTQIGKVGQDGIDSGSTPHLHFELWQIPDATRQPELRYAPDGKQTILLFPGAKPINPNDFWSKHKGSAGLQWPLACHGDDT